MMAGLVDFFDLLSTMISAVMMTGDGDDDGGDVDVCDDDGGDDGDGAPFLSVYDDRFGDESSILTTFSSSDVAASI